MHARGGLRLALATSLAGALACATIDVNSEVTVQPRTHAPPVVANEQLVARDFVADYVQIGPRLLVDIRELRTCVSPRHQPVTRIEHVRRSNRGFVAWDFGLGLATASFAGLVFARPEMFSSRLIDDQGRELIDYSGSYIVGGVFAGISALLLTVGIIDAVRSRDTTHYADAYELELGLEQACRATPELELRERPIELRIGDDQLVLEAVTDARGHARFELPEWPGEPPESGQVPAVITVEPLAGDELEPRVLVFTLWVPYGGVADVQAGVANTRRPDDQRSEGRPLELGPIEGPSEGPGEGPGEDPGRDSQDQSESPTEDPS